jgi:hypothetical protein
LKDKSSTKGFASNKRQQAYSQQKFTQNMEQRITMITLGVEDVDAVAAFYEAMGWRLSDKSMDDLKVFDMGGWLLTLYPKEALAEDAGLYVSGSGFRGFSLSQNCRSEQEVDAVMHKAASLGAKIVKPAQKAFWGGYSGYFEDLGGNLMEVAYNPFWELDQDGKLI